MSDLMPAAFAPDQVCEGCDICLVSTANICPVSTEDTYPVSTEDATAAGLRPAAVMSSVKAG